MMKKFICVLLIIIVAISIAGCQQEKVDSIKFPESGIPLDVVDIPEGPYTKITADWTIYTDAAKLIAASDMIFIGEITDIEFQVLDASNALPVSETTPDYARTLYTLYNVNILETYKGDTSNIKQVRIMGGMVDYKVEEQLTVLDEGSAFKRELGIPIWDNFYKTQCQENECYLFVVRQFETGCPTIINLEQAIYNLEEPTRKNTLGNNNNAYYTGDTDEYNNPLISAYDIISEYGDGKAETFYTEWSSGKYSSK